MTLDVPRTGPPSTDMEAMVEHVELLTMQELRELHEGSTKRKTRPESDGADTDRASS